MLEGLPARPPGTSLQAHLSPRADWPGLPPHQHTLPLGSLLPSEHLK